MRVQGPPRLSSKFEASIGYSKMREEGRRGKIERGGRKECTREGGKEGVLNTFKGCCVTSMASRL